MKVKAFVEAAKARRSRSWSRQRLAFTRRVRGPYDWAEDEELAAWSKRSAQLMGEPDSTGRFGNFGGRFVPEALVPACQDLERDFRAAWSNRAFKGRYKAVLHDYAGRPSALTECQNLSEQPRCARAAEARGPQPHR